MADTPLEAGTEAPPAARSTVRSKRLRGWLTVALVVLSSIAVLASSLAIWSKRTLLNTDVFVRRTSAVISDPQVTSALSTYLTGQVLMAVDAKAEASTALPPQAQKLVGPFVAAIGSYVEQKVNEALQSDAVQNTLSTLLRQVHSNTMDLLEGKKVAGAQLQGDAVVLNTLPIIADVLRRLGLDGVVDKLAGLPAFGGDEPPPAQIQRLKDATGISLPPDFGQVTLITSSSLAQARDGLQVFRRVVVLIVIVTLVLLALTLLVSPRRRRTLVQLGIGIAVAMAVGIAVVRWAENKVVDDVAQRLSDPKAPGAHAARAAADDLLSGLRTLTWVLLALGLVIAVIAFVFGSSAVAGRLRRPRGGGDADATGGVLSTLGAHADAVRIVGVGLAVGLILWLGLTAWSILGALVLAALGFVLAAVAKPHAAPPAAPPEAPAAPAGRIDVESTS